MENQSTTATPPPEETTSCDQPTRKRKSSPKVEEDLEKDSHPSKKLRRERSLSADEIEECKALDDIL